MTALPAPKGTGAAGKALWVAVTEVYELAGHELAVLRSAVVVADRVAALDAVVDRDGVVLDDPKRGPVAHPGLVESRQQRITQARLLTSLRLPDADGAVPQYRGLRGVYSGGARGSA